MLCGRCWPGQTTRAHPRARCPCPATEAPACSRVSIWRTRTRSPSWSATSSSAQRTPMLLLDLNVCIYAFRRESRGHEKFKSWLEQALSGPEPVGLPEQVLASVVRLVTNHRIYQDPSTPSAALSFCDSLMDCLLYTSDAADALTRVD